MASLNKATLIGNLGNDPKLQTSQDGLSVAKFNIATNDVWKDKNGENQERTDWHRIKTFGRLAEICGEYLAKGQQVYIEGRIQTRKWKDKDGIKRSNTEIIASHMIMLGAKVPGDGAKMPADTQ